MKYIKKLKFQRNQKEIQPYSSDKTDIGQRTKLV
jgi:hypothetical protein